METWRKVVILSCTCLAILVIFLWQRAYKADKEKHRLNSKHDSTIILDGSLDSVTFQSGGGYVFFSGNYLVDENLSKLLQYSDSVTKYAAKFKGK